MSTHTRITTDLNGTALAAAIAAELGVTPAQGHLIVQVFADVVTRTVTAGHKVNVTTFGTFKPVRLAERGARNPHTGVPIIAPPVTRARFQPSPRLQQIVGAGDPTASRRKRPKSTKAVR